MLTFATKLMLQIKNVTIANSISLVQSKLLFEPFQPWLVSRCDGYISTISCDIHLRAYRLSLIVRISWKLFVRRHDATMIRSTTIELWYMRLIISLKGLLKDPYFQSFMSKKRWYLKNVFWMIDLEIRVKVTVDIIICLDTFNDYITKISLAKNSQLNQNEKPSKQICTKYSDFYGI